MMNSLPILQNEKNSLQEHVFGIIDTKIQYIDYQTKKLVNGLLGLGEADVPLPVDHLDELFQFDLALPNCNSFLDRMEEYSKSKRLLLTMRSQLKEENAKLIFGFLSDNCFLKFDEEELKKLLEPKAKK